MKSIFLADCHLQNPEDSAYRDLLKFFARLPGDLDNLFILGDFFDFWHGYPNPKVVFSRYLPILDALKKLSASGVNIHFFAGNHEVSFGPALQLFATCHLHNLITEIDGQKVYLAHGDRLNPEDYLFRLWLSIIRSRFTQRLIDTLPRQVTLKIVGFLSRGGQESNAGKKNLPPQVLRSCAALLKQKDNIQAIIIGHFHQERQERFVTSKMGRKYLYVLGDWVNDRSFLLLENGRFSFENSSTF